MKKVCQCFLSLLCICFAHITPLCGMENTISDEDWLRNRKLKIIVADDNQTQRMILAKILGSITDSITFVTNGSLLLSRFTPSIHKLILTDGNMPVMDGYTAIRSLKEGEGANKLPPIIAITSNTTEAEIAMFMDAGADGFVPKPLEKSKLLSEMRRCLEKGLKTTEALQPAD